MIDMLDKEKLPAIYNLQLLWNKFTQIITPAQRHPFYQMFNKKFKILCGPEKKWLVGRIWPAGRSVPTPALDVAFRVHVHNGACYPWPRVCRRYSSCSIFFPHTWWLRMFCWLLFVQWYDLIAWGSTNISRISKGYSIHTVYYLCLLLIFVLFELLMTPLFIHCLWWIPIWSCVPWPNRSVW